MKAITVEPKKSGATRYEDIPGQYTERGIKEIHSFMSERWRTEPEYAIKVDSSLGILGVLPEPMTVITKALEQNFLIGQRAYYATRILLQYGFKAHNLSGGMLSRTILSTD